MTAVARYQHGPRSQRLAGGRRLTRPRRSVAIGLWLPLTPLAVLAAPLALIAAPFAQLVAARLRVSPWRAVLAIGGVLMALSGTIVEVESPTARIRIRIF